MPRRPRLLIEGGIYHVYNRFARGEEIFAENGEAARFLDLLRDVKQRDQLTVFAWCLMSNHYHVALRTGPVPLPRSIGPLQARFGYGYNRRRDSSGPRWQSRYNAQIVTNERYLLQLIAYIHLNPVTAEIVRRADDYMLSGHRELLRTEPKPLVDVDQVLGMYGDSLVEARANYLSALSGTRNASWSRNLPGNLPWWRHEPDRPLETGIRGVWVDERGVSTGRVRPSTTAEGFIDAASRAIGIDVEVLASRSRLKYAVTCRILLATLGVERWAIRPRDIGVVLSRRADVVTRWVRFGADQRMKDRGFAQRYERLDDLLSRELAAGSGEVPN
jgi:REP element-mobilizing transposase RayT